MSVRFWTALGAALLLSSCAEPPNREMDQAQGAIDGARAAGAEQYAAEELAAAVAALKQSHDAVAQRDYRSAFNYALDSRERAQNAAKQASDERAALGSRTERALTELKALIDRGDRLVETAESQRIPRRAMTRAASALKAARTAVQKAGTAAERGDYQAALRELEAASQEATAAIAEFDKAMAARPARPRR